MLDSLLWFAGGRYSPGTENDINGLNGAIQRKGADVSIVFKLFVTLRCYLAMCVSVLCMHVL